MPCSEDRNEEFRKLNRAVFGENGDNGMSRDVHDLKMFAKAVEKTHDTILRFLIGIASAVAVMAIGGIVSAFLFVSWLMHTSGKP